MRTTIAALGTAAVLAACGGGDGNSSSPAPAPVVTAEGLYQGTTNTGRSVNGLVLDDGSFWVLYSVVGSPSTIAGAVQGNGSSNNGSFTSSNAKDFNLEGLGILSATVSASYVAKQSLNGTITYTSPAASTTFTSTYNKDYEKTPALGTIGGSYAGTAVSSAAAGPTGVSFNGGAVAFAGPGTCTSTGSATTRAHGNVYNVTTTFAGATCVLAGKTYSGIAYLDSSNGLEVAMVTSDRSDGVLFVGAKQ
jgi:hypothetical protein